MNNMKMYLGGELVDSGEVFDVICPGDNRIVGSIAWAGTVHTQVALETASTALETWAALPVRERTAWMRTLRETVIDDEHTLRDLVHLETGKTWKETNEDYESLVDSLGYYADEMEALKAEALPDSTQYLHTLEYSAIGVVGAFIAWNFPLLNLGFKLGPAMATGCPIIIKPSEKSPMSAYRIGELCAKIGLPPGVVNILCGPDDVVGDGISSSKVPAMLTVIGSTATGRRVMTMGASSIKRYSMELGGNAPVIVYRDADISHAAAVIGDLKFGNAGQACVAPNRVYVHHDVAAALTDLLVQRAQSIRLGFANDDSVDMGPLIDMRARERVSALVDSAKAQGAHILVGGSAIPQTEQEGSYFEPTIMTDVAPGMRLHDEEVFGPVVSIIEFTDDDEVIAHANATDAGLASYIFTTDLDKARRTARELAFGEVQVNGVKYAIDLPHIGVKQSGIGCDCSPIALHEYLKMKRVTETLPR